MYNQILPLLHVLGDLDTIKSVYEVQRNKEGLKCLAVIGHAKRVCFVDVIGSVYNSGVITSVDRRVSITLSSEGFHYVNEDSMGVIRESSPDLISFLKTDIGKKLIEDGLADAVSEALTIAMIAGIYTK